MILLRLGIFKMAPVFQQFYALHLRNSKEKAEKSSGKNGTKFVDVNFVQSAGEQTNTGAKSRACAHGQTNT